MSNSTHRLYRLASTLLVVVVLASSAIGVIIRPTSTTAAPIVEQATIMLDGVHLSLETPFLPGGKFHPGAQDGVTRNTYAATLQPLRTLSIVAAPFGTAPGTESVPVAQAGGEQAYRESLRSFHISRGGQSLGSIEVHLFGRTIVGEVMLDTASYTPNPLLVIEWITEAGPRIWIVRVVRELEGVEGQAVRSGNTGAILSSTFVTSLAHLALSSDNVNDPSPAAQVTQHQNDARAEPNDATVTHPSIPTDMSPEDIPFPSWWNGSMCRASGHSGSYPLGATFQGLVACGPFNHTVPIEFFPGAVDQLEWQCAELSKRWLWLAYQVEPYWANGFEMVGNYNGLRMQKIWNRTPGRAPQPGDVLSYGDYNPGHTSVVTHSDVDAGGTGHINVIEQNYSATGTSQLNVLGWQVIGNAGPVLGWLHRGSIGQVTGTVTQQGVPVAGAHVHSSSNGEPTTTDGDGNYAFLNLPPGPITVTATSGGNSGSRSGDVIANASLRLDIEITQCTPQAGINGSQPYPCATPPPGATPTPDPGAPFTLSNPTYTVPPGQQFNVTVHLQSNSYQFSETRGDHLFLLDEGYGAWPVNNIRGNVGPGGSFDFNMTMTAPPNQGTYTSHWQMKVGGNLVGPVSTITIISTSGPQPTPPPPNSWHVEYYAERDMRNRCHDTYEPYTYIFKDWGIGSPDPGCPSGDNWAARFTKDVYFPGGYTWVHTYHDDGVRVWIDNDLWIDAWWSGHAGHDLARNINEGYHQVRVEYFEEGGDALLEVFFEGPGYIPAHEVPDENLWFVEYWGNRNLDNWRPAIALNQDAGSLMYNWGQGGPPYSMPSDNFSARFRRNIYLPCGLHRFTITADDGVRLWVNDSLVLDEWHPANSTYTRDVNLPGGITSLRVEYFENGGDAQLQLSWAEVGGCTITPTPTPPPSVCDTGFADMPPDHTFHSFAMCLVCSSVISGYPCGGPGEPCTGESAWYFRPGNLLTRGQLAKIVAQSAGFNEPVSEISFADVPASHTFYEHIGRLALHEVMSGYACGGPGEPCGVGNLPYFRPGASATRGQLTKIVANAEGMSDPVPETYTFADVPLGSPFHPFVERLVANRPGVLSGYACGGVGEPCDEQSRPYLRVASLLTRGQAAKIVTTTFFPQCSW